jgi:DNA-binding transcriptional regulator YhcF (GntR family)
MTPPADRNIAGLHVRRESPVPVFLQLKSQLEYLIVTGKFPPGHRLPSIRQVARSLGVGPATVVRAYQELVTAGLAVPHEAVGFFVTGAEPAWSRPHARVRDQVTALLEGAVQDGLSIDQVLQIFLAQVAELRVSQSRPEIIVVCKPGGRTEELAMHLRHALADLGVEVTGATLDAVAADLGGWLPRLQKAQCVVSLMFDVQQARSLLAARGIDVMPLLGALREDTRDKIISLPAGTRTGIVSGALDFVDGMITAATSLNPGLAITGACDSSDRDGISQLLAGSDCIIYGTLARHVIDRQLPPSTEAIELIYIPDDSSIQRLRRLLRDERP